MRIRTLCVLVKILKDYHELLVASQAKVNRFWIACFTKDEFRSMIPGASKSTLSSGNVQPTYDELLNLVGKEEYIIGYMIKKLEAILPRQMQYLTSTLVHDALNQLGLRFHYLFEKNANNYDEYDVANVMGILRKVGWARQIWAFFDVDVEPNEALEIATLPSIFYDTSTEAEEMYAILVAEGYFNESEIKVLKSECIINPKQL